MKTLKKILNLTIRTLLLPVRVLGLIYLLIGYKIVTYGRARRINKRNA